MGAKRGLNIAELRQDRNRIPGNLQPIRGFDCIFLARGDDANEIRDSDDGDETGNVADRAFVDRNEARADEGPGVASR